MSLKVLLATALANKYTQIISPDIIVIEDSMVIPFSSVTQTKYKVLFSYRGECYTAIFPYEDKSYGDPELHVGWL